MGRRFPVRHARHVFREFLLKNTLLALCFFFAVCFCGGVVAEVDAADQLAHNEEVNALFHDGRL